MSYALNHVARKNTCYLLLSFMLFNVLPLCLFVNFNGRNFLSGKLLFAQEVQPSVLEERGAENIIGTQEFDSGRLKISLDGEWEFSYDLVNAGVKEKWHLGTVLLPEKTKVPGCTQSEYHPSAGETKPSGDLKYPCQSPGWHRKIFTVPDSWKDKEIFLHIGGVKPAAVFWCNGTKLGATYTSRSPVKCDISKYLKFGEENNIVVKVFWPSGPRLDGCFEFIVPWSGLYRSVWIEAVSKIHLTDIHVKTQTTPRGADINFTVNSEQICDDIRVVCHVTGLHDGLSLVQEKHIQLTSGASSHSIPFNLSEALLWSPENPNLYTAELGIYDGYTLLDNAVVRFGVRDVKTKGEKVYLNGAPIFIRAGCDDHIYPETICPPASKNWYIERIKKAKKYGFNATKSCIEVFTQEFMDAADEAGYLVCQEMPFGLMGDYRLVHREQPTPEWAEMYRQELRNIICSDRNHPSVYMYSMTSEMGVNGISDLSFELFCRELPKTALELNPSALVIDITHTGSWSVSTRRGERLTHIIENTTEDQKDQEPLAFPLQGKWQEVTCPFILHEYAWWTSLPDPSLTSRYADLPYLPRGAPEMVKATREKGLIDQLPIFVRNSQKLKYALVKDGMEVARRHRHPLIAGYHFWLIVDFPWCPEGVFNEFWEEPEDLPAEEFRTYNDDTVLLLDDDNRRCFRNGDRSPLAIEISHFGPEPFMNPQLRWELIASGMTVAEASISVAPLECGVLSSPYGLDLRLPEGMEPVQYELKVRLIEGGKEINYNHWNIWGYPRPNPGPWCSRISTDISYLRDSYSGMKELTDYSSPSTEVIVTDKMTDDVISFLTDGGNVVLFSDSVLKEFRPGIEYAPGKTLGFEWHNSWSNKYRSPAWNMGEGNMGTVIKAHPALGKLSHDGWCDLNFVHLISGIYPITLELFYPQRIDPIVRSIGFQFSMVDKAYLFEVVAGKGSLLVTSFKIRDTYKSHPETQYLVESLLKYAVGNEFKPEASITTEQLKAGLY